MSRWRPKGPKKARARGLEPPTHPRELSIARALASFGGVDEAALCAFLEEMEKARLEGQLVIGWRVTRDAAACGFEVMYADGQIAHVRAPTFREASSQLGQLMVEAAMEGAPKA